MNTPATVRRHGFISYTAFAPRLAALALSLGVSVGALAVPAAGDSLQPPAGSQRAHGTYAMHPGMHGIRPMSRLHDELKLDAKQEALWNDAVRADQQTMTGMHERMRKEREETLALLNQPGADLRAVARRMDEGQAEAQKQHAAARENWFVVYDALTPEQKEQARVFFRNRLERMGEARQAPRAQRTPNRG